MNHPQHDLLIAAANDKDARFTYNTSSNTWSIEYVIENPNLPWKLVDKFAELKKARKEGKTIQVLLPTKWSDCPNPTWNTDAEYRIKPEPIYEWQWLGMIDGVCKTSVFYTEKPTELSMKLLYRIEESKREVKP